MDSTGLHVLNRARLALAERGDQVVLHAPHPVVRRVFEVSGLLDLFVLDGPVPPASE
jgi:anti-anti-sigma factor